MITDYFLSSHTGQGYHSFLEMTLSDLEQVFIFKGISVQVKSRIFRNIGLKLVDRGYDIEFLHGVDNAYNLEGVIIPEKALALIDADNHPGIENRLVEINIKLFNLNQFKDKEKFKIFQAKIRDLKEQIAVSLELAYEELQEKRDSYFKQLVSQPTVPENQTQNLAEKIAKSLFFKKQGKIYHRFARCLTGGGEIDYYHNLLKDSQERYVLNGLSYNTGCNILAFLAKEGIKGGLRVEAYHNCLDPRYIELLILPELSLVISAQAIFADFQELLSYKDLKNNLTYLNQNNYPQKLDISNGLARLAEVKELNELLGDLYQETVDFVGIENLEEELLKRILNSNCLSK